MTRWLRIIALCLFCLAVGLPVWGQPPEGWDRHLDGYRGPYRGQVVDADTKAPLGGAVVVVYWSRDRIYPMHSVNEPYAVRETVTRHEVKHPNRLMLLHRLLGELTDGFFPVLSEFDDQIDEIQDAILAKPTDQQLADLFTMKRWLIMVRKVITPQRDMIASLVSGVTELPGMTRDIERYFRDLYDHLIRISDLVDSYRDLLTGSLDSYLSTVSNRLNVVMKQLTIIATIFLPLSFLTGFFGQNFAWMVDRLTSLGVFLGLGIGTEVVAVALLLWLFHRRGWF